MAIVTNINDGAITMVSSDGALQKNSPSLLSRITGIDGKAVGDNIIYTVPSGKVLKITMVILEMTNVAGLVTVGTASINNLSFASNICPSVALTGLSGNGKIFYFIPTTTTAVDPLNPTGQVSLNFSVGYVATTATIKADLIGYLT